MWVYEKNYVCLVRLLPFLFECKGLISVCARHSNSRLAVSILEQCRYTQVVEIKHIFNEASQYIHELSMKVRIYHDAQLAEVISYQGHSRMHSKYPYPNQKMFHRDEKRQANYLLHDWLDTMKEVEFDFEHECLSPEV
jgi:uncharacterized protein YqiB (DUF1249 family)